MPRTARPFRCPGARIPITFFCLVVLAGCDNFPRDPNDTLERVLATERIRVAAVDHVPWVVVDGAGAPEGAEVALVEAFARELGSTVQWFRAPSFEAMEALERGDADLAIGGLTREAVAAHAGVAPSYAYFDDALVVAAEPGQPVPEDLEGERVHVPPTLMAGGLILQKGGVPVAENTAEVDLVALRGWELPASGLVPTGIVLRRQARVMAVPQGENAWLMRLERFLRRAAAGLPGALREHAR